MRAQSAARAALAPLAPPEVKLRYDLGNNVVISEKVWLEPFHMSKRNMTEATQDNLEPDRLAERAGTGLTELLGYLTTEWDDDRRALSRQLHDSLGSSLTALSMHLGRLDLQIAPDNTLHERVAQMKGLLLTIIDSNRELQTRLWNDQLEFLGLKVALAELVGQFRDCHAIRASVSLPDQELNYPRVCNVALLRALEQGLSNVAAHANASEVDVILDDNEHDIMLTVRDNGIGIDIDIDAREQRNKHGLRTLRERAIYLHGTLTVAARTDGGTLMVLKLPKNCNA